MIDALFQLFPGIGATLVAVCGGVVIAGICALLAGTASRSGPIVFRLIARAYIECFRGTSVLVQLFWFYYVVPPLLHVDPPLQFIAMLVLGLNVGSYGAEVVRGALQSVDKGQLDAAHALSLKPYQAYARIILPQAIPQMVPTFSNLVVELIKASSLIGLVSLVDIMRIARTTIEQSPKQVLLVLFGALCLYGVISWLALLIVKQWERPVLRRWCGRLLQPALAPVGWLIWWLCHHHGRAVSWTVGLFALAAAALVAVLAAEQWQWDHAIDSTAYLLDGIGMTVLATAGGAAIALSLGAVWSMLRTTRFLGRPLRWLLDFIRATPPYTQLLLVYFGLAPALGLALPAWLIGLVTLGIHYSTYTAEVYRSGVEAVPAGQREAARSLGLSPWQIATRIIYPQAIPRVLPALGNYVIALFKETPLLMTITVAEMLFMADGYASMHFRFMEPYTMLGILFLLLSLVSASGVRLLERIFPVRHA